MVIIVTMIAIVGIVIQNQAVFLKTNVWEIVMVATMPNGARPHLHRRHRQHPRTRNASPRMVLMPSRHAGMPAMMIAIVEFATLTLVACLLKLVWALATRVGTQSGVARLLHHPHQHHLSRLRLHQYLGQLPQIVCSVMAKMWSFMVSGQHAPSTCCVVLE